MAVDSTSHEPQLPVSDPVLGQSAATTKEDEVPVELGIIARADGGSIRPLLTQRVQVQPSDSRHSSALKRRMDLVFGDSIRRVEEARRKRLRGSKGLLLGKRSLVG